MSEAAVRSSSLMAGVEAAVARRPVLGNGYFTALADDTMDAAIFRRTQMQFFFAVRFFSRPMAALMARMPDSASRQGLIHNLSEEKRPPGR